MSHSLKGTTPYVWVADVPKAVPYYRDVLGFEVEYDEEWSCDGEKFGLAIMARDEVTLQLQVCECGDYRHTGLSFFRMQVEDIDGLYEEWKEKGAKIRFEIKTQDFGARDFQIEDPEGNRIYLYEWLS